MDFAVLRLSSFGDIVLTEPLTRAVKQAFPEARLTFITRSDFAGLVRLFPAVDDVVPVSRGGQDEAARGASPDVVFDGVLDLQNSLRSRAVSRRLRKRKLARYRRPLMRRFALVRMPWLWRGTLRHTIDLYGDALARLGVELTERVPRIEAGEEARRLAGLRLDAPGALVAVCPGGSSPYKRWPEACFTEVACGLASSGRDVVVLGGEKDRDVVQSVARQADHPRIRALVSREFAETAAVLSLARVTLSNDSGLMHLAAAAGSRVVAVFGPTSPRLGFAPLGDGHRVLSLDLDCSPCSYHGNRPCRLLRRACMEDIGPGEVRRQVEEALEEARRDG
jgi:lipopolysaccharide heptosyltransferase II